MTKTSQIEHPQRGSGMRSEMAEFGAASPLPDFGDTAVRRRLGPSALTLFRRIAEELQVPNENARQLLGLAAGTDLDKIDPDRLSEDQMLRISYLIGIYEALHRVHGDPLADEWVRLPNTNAIFGGETPLAYMFRGGTDALQKLRRYLEGRTQGH
jgi:hypothetical protein